VSIAIDDLESARRLVVENRVPNARVMRGDARCEVILVAMTSN
jgi:hypothetical protein